MSFHRFFFFFYISRNLWVFHYGSQKLFTHQPQGISLFSYPVSFLRPESSKVDPISFDLLRNEGGFSFFFDLLDVLVLKSALVVSQLYYWLSEL